MPFAVENHSPFPHRAFLKTAPDGTELGVLAVRATYDWVHGGDMTVCSEQQPVVESDQLDGPREDAALRLESDLVPGKPTADVLVVGHARAPRGEPAKDWIAMIQIGNLSKRMRVTGPRFWEKGALGYRLTPAEPVDRVPLSYRVAFGGTRRRTGLRGEVEVDAFDANPVGVGYLGRFPASERRFPAPQTEAADAPITSLSSRPAPEGFGPVARSWAPRLQRAGTLTPEFVLANPKRLPDDFDWSFYNSASPGLIYPEHLRGDEAITTLGLFGEGLSTSHLPGYKPLGVGGLTNGIPLRLDPCLDTIAVDTDSRRVHATYRLTFPRKLGVRALVIGFSVPPPRAGAAPLVQLGKKG